MLYFAAGIGGVSRLPIFVSPLWLLPCADAFSLATLSGFACEVLQDGCGSGYPFGGVVGCGFVCLVAKAHGSSRVVRLNFGGDQVT
jgi:hypothetical protein